MSRKICSRCGVELVEGTYYTIDIYGYDVNPTNDGKVTLAAACRNIATNSIKASGAQEVYCQKCIDAIDKFIAKRSDCDISASELWPKRNPFLK